MSDALQWLMSEWFIGQCPWLVVLICNEDRQTRAGASDSCHVLLDTARSDEPLISL